MQEFNQEKQIEQNEVELSETRETSIIVEKPSPNNPPWNSFFAFLLWLTSVGLIVILPSLFLMPYLFGKNIQVADNTEFRNFLFSDPTAVVISLGGTMVAHLLTLVFAWFIVTKYNTYSFKEMLGWRWGGFKFWHGFAILIGVYAVALTMINLLGSQENEMTRILQSSRTAVFMVAILATFSAPIVEEVIYRGVLYSAFQRTVNSTFAVIIVTALFAAVHIPQYSPDYATIISICFVSLVITLIRVKTDNLLPCIIFHMVFNGIQAVLMILHPYIPLPETLNPVPEKASFFLSLPYFVSQVY